MYVNSILSSELKKDWNENLAAIFEAKLNAAIVRQGIKIHSFVPDVFLVI
jgi:hypothetical protein